MFPYRDENETQRTAIVTGTIIGLNVLTWIVAQGAGDAIPLAAFPSASLDLFPES